MHHGSINGVIHEYFAPKYAIHPITGVHTRPYERVHHDCTANNQSSASKIPPLSRRERGSNAELPGEARRERLPVNLASPPVAVTVTQRAKRVDEAAAASAAHRAAAGGKVAVSTYRVEDRPCRMAELRTGKRLRRMARQRCFFFLRSTPRLRSSIPSPPQTTGSGHTRKQSKLLALSSISKEVGTRCRCPSYEQLLEGCGSPFMRLAEHLTALRAWRKKMSAWLVKNPTCSVPA